jgi:hypothetical protein
MNSLFATTIRIVSLLFVLQMISSCDKVQNMYESRNDGKLAEAKHWPDADVPQIGAKCTMSTSWREGVMYYIFNAKPMINSNNSSEDKTQEFSRAIVLNFGLPKFKAIFFDKAGFEIISIDMNEMSRIVDVNGKPIYMRDNFNIECSRKKYQDIAAWTVSWRDY